MTESEAIKELETSIDFAKMCIQNCERKNEIQGYEMAIKALEEVQQYRAIGTVEELETASKYMRLVKKHGTVGKTIEACAEYEGIGTVEECRAAVEKQIRKPAKNPYGTIWKAGYCPVCGCGVTARRDYCQCCGQKLSWEV